MSDKELKVQVLRPFGPPIFKVKIPNELIIKINDYSELVFNDKKKLKTLDHGDQLAGNVTQEFLLEENFARDSGWLKFLSIVSNHVIKSFLNKDIKSFNVTSTWVVRQFQNEYNPVHNHTAHLSGVGYLKVPTNFGDTVQKKNENRNKNGKIMFVHGSQQFLSRAILGITPAVGDFYLFPSYLLHLVNPYYDTSEERRSISFNATIDESLINE